MSNRFAVRRTITINAPLNKVWQALTDPALIKQYLFGTETISDWERGSTITYKGEWQGQHYEDKGVIIDIIPDRLLHTTYYSSMSGKPDFPEYYANVIYELKAEGDHTVIHFTQDNIETEEALKHSEQNWDGVFAEMKKLLEK